MAVKQAGEIVSWGIGMSKAGRITGHGLGIFFVLMGIGFVALGVSEFSNWLDENSTCTSGNCSEASARGTFLIIGFSFIAGGLFTSVVTELVVRKTQRLFAQVANVSTGDLATTQGLAEFLEPFGIDIDAARAAGAEVNVQRGFVDLRGQRRGDVPTDPAGLNDYLKGFGINLGEEALKNATVVDTSRGANRLDSAAEPERIAAVRAEDSERETATIIRKKDRGATAGNQRLVEFELEVQPAGRAPYRVEVASLVRESLVGLLIEGSTLNVRVDPLDRNSVTIDWAEN